MVKGKILPSTKTGEDRSPELFQPVRTDLAAWRLKRPHVVTDEHDLLFRRSDGEPWADHDYRNWRKRRFRKAVAAAGSKVARPYDLRHVCASLMLRDGRWSLVEVAAHMGHSVQVLSSTYAHVIAGLKGGQRRSFEDEIAAARQLVAQDRKSA